MDENIFWLRIWQTVAALVATGILTAGGCTAYESKRIADAIDGGKDPIAAKCAISGINSSNSMAPICAVKAVQ